MYKLVTREDERRIKKHQDAIIKALERSSLVIENADFFENLQAKVEQQNQIEREKCESEKAFKKRQILQRRQNMVAYLSGFLFAHVGEVYPEVYGIPFFQQLAVFECIAKWIVEVFTQDFPAKEDYGAAIYEKIYHKVYDNLVTLPNRRLSLKKSKVIKKDILEEVFNANKNAT